MITTSQHKTTENKVEYTYFESQSDVNAFLANKQMHGYRGYFIKLREGRFEVRTFK